MPHRAQDGSTVLHSIQSLKSLPHPVSHSGKWVDLRHTLTSLSAFFLNGIVGLFVSVPLWGYQESHVPLFLVLEVCQLVSAQIKSEDFNDSRAGWSDVLGNHSSSLFALCFVLFF